MKTRLFLLRSRANNRSSGECSVEGSAHRGLGSQRVVVIDYILPPSPALFSQTWLASVGLSKVKLLGRIPGRRVVRQARRQSKTALRTFVYQIPLGFCQPFNSQSKYVDSGSKINMLVTPLLLTAFVYAVK